MAGDHHLEHLGGTLIDAKSADVSVQSLSCRTLDETVGAVDLHAAIDRALRRLGREELGNGRFVSYPRCALVLLRSGPLDEQPGCVDFRGGFGEQELNALQRR